MSVWKDLSAIHYVDDSPGYYERSDIAFEFQSDGSLTMTETYNRERDGSNPNVSVYHIVYENGLPVSCPESKVAVTYDAKGLPATLSTEDGAKTWTFLGHPRVLLAATMKEPKAQGMVACFWANYSYNSNGDNTRFERAYFSADQVYNDYFGKCFYDDSFFKEAARQTVNQWIRTNKEADGFIDFDAAMRDPAMPSQLREDLQEDWLHPNARGYQVMGEYAAKFFLGL
jgi:hypothetical protein